MKPIPDERFAHFVTRRIGGKREDDLLTLSETLIKQFIAEGTEMQISRLTDLEHTLCRLIPLVQTARHAALLRRLPTPKHHKKKRN